jgi:hypothetical protein
MLHARIFLTEPCMNGSVDPYLCTDKLILGKWGKVQGAKFHFFFYFWPPCNSFSYSHNTLSTTNQVGTCLFSGIVLNTSTDSISFNGYKIAANYIWQLYSVFLISQLQTGRALSHITIIAFISFLSCMCADMGARTPMGACRNYQYFCLIFVNDFFGQECISPYKRWLRAVIGNLWFKILLELWIYNLYQSILHLDPMLAHLAL